MFSLVVFNCHVEMELLTCNIVCYLTNDNYLYQLTIILSIYITLIDKILQLQNILIGLYFKNLKTTFRYSLYHVCYIFLMIPKIYSTEFVRTSGDNNGLLINHGQLTQHYCISQKVCTREQLLTFTSVTERQLRFLHFELRASLSVTDNMVVIIAVVLVNVRQ